MEPLLSPMVATRGNQPQMVRPQTRQNRCRKIATGCRERSTRRGSTVRVRQRALQNPRTPRVSRSDLFAERAGCGGYGAVYGALPLARAITGRQVRVPRRRAMVDAMGKPSDIGNG